MALTTADQARTLTEVIPTTADLDAKYALVQGLITQAANDSRYSVDVTLGSEEQAQFIAWIKSYGYRVIAAASAGTSIRKILGSQVNLTVLWTRYTITTASTLVAEGGVITYTVTTKGVANSTAYWTILGTAQAPDFTPTVSEGSVTITSGTGTISISVALDALADPGETVILKLYYDSQKTDLVATAPTVTVT